MDSDAIFQPLQFRNLTVKNRLFRSSISGRWDNEDGSGTQARINWEEKFAKGGVGAIISSFVPVHHRGRILAHYAMIESDDRIPFWRQVGERVHAHDCKFILQLSHAERQRDSRDAGLAPSRRGAEPSAPRRTGSFPLPFAEPASRGEIPSLVDCFAQGARRAREAGLDGIELHASRGCLFPSSGGGDRDGSLRDRYGFLQEVIRAIRREVGNDFHLQVKMNAGGEAQGTAFEECIQVCRWLEEDGADGLHISAGSTFPLVPPGVSLPDELNGWYGGMQSSGVRGFFPNYTLLHYKRLRPVLHRLWQRTKKRPAEASGMALCREIRQRVKVPVIDAGGFQDGALIRRGLREGWFDGVSMARPLIANNDLPRVLAAGRDVPARPCSFCNRCLVNAMTNPLGCYDQRRFASRDAMIGEVMSVYQGPCNSPVLVS
jgi:2,4-dienoyl-CoA reductase (NADPH2)